MGIKGGMNNHILIDTLLSDITAPTPTTIRTKKARSMKYIKTILNHFKKSGYIKDYEVLGKNGKKATKNTPAYNIRIDL